MDVAISRLADVLETFVNVAFDVDPSGISDYCDTLSEPAHVGRAPARNVNFRMLIFVDTEV